MGMMSRSDSRDIHTTSPEQSPNIQQFETGGLRAHLVLIVMTFLLILNYADCQILSVVLELMKIDLGLTDAQAGGLQTGFLISHALLAFPIAYLVDRWSRRKSIGLMAIFWSIFSYMTGLANSFMGVLIPRFFVGGGEAALMAEGNAWISASHEKHLRCRILGIFSTFLPLGGALGVMLGGYLAVKYGSWRVPFFIFAVPGIILGIAWISASYEKHLSCRILGISSAVLPLGGALGAILGGYLAVKYRSWQVPFFIFAVPGIILGIVTIFLRNCKTTPSEVGKDGKKASYLSTIGTLFRIPTLRWLYIGYAMQNVMTFSFLTWLPAYLMRAQNLDAAKAGTIAGVVAIMSVMCVPLGGVIANKWQLRNTRGRMLLPAICLGITSVFFVLTFTFKVAGIGLAFAFLYGIFSVMGLPFVAAATQNVAHPSLKGTAWGLAVFCMFFLGSCWAPILVGVGSDALGGGASGLHVALLCTGAGGFLGSILLWASSQYYSVDAEKVKHFVLEKE